MIAVPQEPSILCLQASGKKRPALRLNTIRLAVLRAKGKHKIEQNKNQGKKKKEE
jgi:hypothetical protein